MNTIFVNSNGSQSYAIKHFILVKMCIKLIPTVSQRRSNVSTSNKDNLKSQLA